MEVLKISSGSKPKLAAGAIASILRNSDSVDVRAIGAGAVNQAVKSIAIARSYVVADGIELVCAPAFIKILVGDEEKTAIKFHVYSANRGPQISAD